MVQAVAALAAASTRRLPILRAVQVGSVVLPSLAAAAQPETITARRQMLSTVKIPVPAVAVAVVSVPQVKPVAARSAGVAAAAVEVGALR